MRVTIEDFSALTADLQKSSGGGQTPLYTPAGPARTLQHDYAGIGAFEETVQLWEKTLRAAGSTMKQSEDRAFGLISAGFTELTTAFIKEKGAGAEEFVRGFSIQDMYPTHAMGKITEKVNADFIEFENIAKEYLKNPKIKAVWNEIKPGLKRSGIVQYKTVYDKEADFRFDAKLVKWKNINTAFVLANSDAPQVDLKTGGSLVPKQEAMVITLIKSQNLGEFREKIAIGELRGHAQLHLIRKQSSSVYTGNKKLSTSYATWVKDNPEAANYYGTEFEKAFLQYLTNQDADKKVRATAALNLANAKADRWAKLFPERFDKVTHKNTLNLDHPLHGITEAQFIRYQTAAKQTQNVNAKQLKKITLEMRNIIKLELDNNLALGKYLRAEVVLEKVIAENPKIFKNHKVQDLLADVIIKSYNSSVAYEKTDLEEIWTDLKLGNKTHAELFNDLNEIGTDEYFEKNYPDGDYLQLKKQRDALLAKIKTGKTNFDLNRGGVAANILEAKDELPDDPLERVKAVNKQSRILSGEANDQTRWSNEELEYYKKRFTDIYTSASEKKAEEYIALLNELETSYIKKGQTLEETIYSEEILHDLLYVQKIAPSEIIAAAYSGNKQLIQDAMFAITMGATLEKDWQRHTDGWENFNSLEKLENLLTDKLNAKFKRASFLKDVDLQDAIENFHGQGVRGLIDRFNNYWGTDERIGVITALTGASGAFRASIYQSIIRNVVARMISSQLGENDVDAVVESVYRQTFQKVEPVAQSGGTAILLDKDGMPPDIHQVSEPIEFAAAVHQVKAFLVDTGKLEITKESVPKLEEYVKTPEGQEQIKDIIRENFAIDDATRDLILLNAGQDRYQVALRVNADTGADSTIPPIKGTFPINGKDGKPLFVTSEQIYNKMRDTRAYLYAETVLSLALTDSPLSIYVPPHKAIPPLDPYTLGLQLTIVPERLNILGKVTMGEWLGVPNADPDKKAIMLIMEKMFLEALEVKADRILSYYEFRMAASIIAKTKRPLNTSTVLQKFLSAFGFVDTRQEDGPQVAPRGLKKALKSIGESK